MAALVIVASLLVLVPALVSSEKRCAGYFPDSTDLFYHDGTCYAVETLYSDDYFRGHMICEEFHPAGNLATIDTPAKNQALSGFLSGKLGAPSDEYFFIGLDDEHESGKFEWLDGTPVVYTNFKQGQGTNPGIHDCVVMDTQGLWYDHKCVVDFDNNEKMRFICQFPANQI